MISRVDYAALSRAVRESLGYTQARLAGEMQVSFGTVNGWENGKHEPIPALASRLVAMARAAGIDPDAPSASAAKHKDSVKRRKRNAAR